MNLEKKIFQQMRLKLSEEIERRWVIDPTDLVWPDEAALPVDKRRITQVYLEAHPPIVSRVRSSNLLLGNQMAHSEVTHMINGGTADGKPLEIVRPITHDEFTNLVMEFRDKDRTVLQKTRSTFSWGSRVWHYEEFSFGLCVLKSTLPESSDLVHTPPWLKVIREITEVPGWSNYEMSHKDWEQPDVV